MLSADKFVLKNENLNFNPKKWKKDMINSFIR